MLISPAVRLLLETYQLNPGLIPATGPKGRLLKGDVLRFVAQGGKPFMKPEEAKIPTQAAPPSENVQSALSQPTVPPQKTKPSTQTSGRCTVFSLTPSFKLKKGVTILAPLNMK